MSRVAIFIDVGNQFYCVNKKWEGRKINYETYKNKASSFGTIVRAFAYGTQIENMAAKFISCLRYLGYEPRYKTVEKNNWFAWEVGIAMDIVRMSDKIDVAVIGNSNRTMVPVLSYLKEKGIRVVVMACGINKEIKETCDQWIEITADMLEEETEEESILKKSILEIETETEKEEETELES